MSGKAYLLDTNIIIGLLKQHAPTLDLLDTYSSVDDLLDTRDCAFSVITRMELLGYPSIDEHESATIERLLAGMQAIPLLTSIEDEAISIRKKSHLKLPDAIIAASARISNRELISLDQQLLKVFATIGQD